MTEIHNEKRFEPRHTRFYSVEFSIKETFFLYQFKLWNISKKGMCILIKEDSSILKYIKLGDSLLMRYYKEGDHNPTKYLRTQIKHITKYTSGKFKGHLLVGLMLLEGEHTISIPPENDDDQPDRP